MRLNVAAYYKWMGKNYTAPTSMFEMFSRGLRTHRHIVSTSAAAQAEQQPTHADGVKGYFVNYAQSLGSSSVLISAAAVTNFQLLKHEHGPGAWLATVRSHTRSHTLV